MKRIFLLSVICCFTVMSFAQKDKLTTTNTSTTPVDKPVLNRIPIKTKQGEDKDAMQMEMTDKAKLAAIEKNIYELTKQVQGLQNKLSATETKLAATENKLSSAENKISASEKKHTVFQVNVTKENMWSIKNSQAPDFKIIGADGIRIDNAACDGNPSAVLFITQQKKTIPSNWGGENAEINNGGGTLYAVYSNKYKKWFIKQYQQVVNGYTDGGHTLKGVWTTFNEGDTFNVLVSK